MRKLLRVVAFAAASSAAIVIVKKDCGVWLHNDLEMRLQVDDHPEPIKELRRLVEIWNRTQKRRGC